VGAAIYAEVYPSLASTVITWGSYGKISIPDVLGINHWIVIVVFIVIFLGLFKFFEKKKI